MTKSETEAYDRGYAHGVRKGRSDVGVMKENADGCCGCAFDTVYPWELPCAHCKRNAKDYWRAKE